MHLRGGLPGAGWDGETRIDREGRREPETDVARFEDGTVIENGVLTAAMAGKGQPSVAAWGVNPHGDNPLLDSGGMPNGDCFAQVRTTVQPPALTAACAAMA